MSSRTVATLNITSGDAVIYLFKKAGILGTHLTWRDVLHEGPVPAGLTLEQLSRVRGEYVAQRGYGRPIKVLHDFEERDALLRRAGSFDEVVLWFEHDLYDQLQILQILTCLCEMKLEPGRVSIIHSDHYLGSMTADEIVALHPKRRTVTDASFERARAIWEAFTGPDPQALLAHAGGEGSTFPHMQAGLRRLCEEFPWKGDGLSRSQRHALQAVAQGAGRDEELFRRAQSREEAPFLGDRPFFAIVADLKQSPAPLIEEIDGVLVPTALGRRVLAGDADWLEEQPIDRWIGGSHIADGFVPRWNETTRGFEVPRAAVDS